MIELKQIRNPFPGLRPFTTDEYLLFFGREGQSDELLARLQRSRFLAVVGTSGSGKSSLIRAGLMPALQSGMMEGAGAGWRIAVMRPGSDPIGNLAAELVKKEVLSEAGAGLQVDEAAALIDATLRSSSLGIVAVAKQGRLGEDEKLLVVVDQFEELFRFRAAREGTSSADEAAAFVKLLLEAAQQRELSIYIVLTMRSDFLGDCAQFQGLPEAINDGQYLIPRMTRDERRFAVTGPIGVTRGKIAATLVNRLLNDVGDQPDQLPILQHALMRTWEHWQTQRSNGEAIGIEHYEAIGTMSDALSRHADEAFNELPDDRRRRIAEVLFKSLSERGGDNREIRRPTRLDAICDIAGASMQEVIAVIDVFREGARSFLMPPIDTVLQPETVIDISHESLIRNWQRLKDWVNEEAQSARIYRRVAEAAVLHQEGSEGLLQDPGLQIALDWQRENKPNAAWAKRYHTDFDTAITYLNDSCNAREARIAAEEKRRNEEIERDRRELEQTKVFVAQQARSARRMRFLIVALCLILLLALGTAAYAFNLRAIAENSRREAEGSRLQAEGSRAVAEAAALDAKKANAQMNIEREKAEAAAKAAGQQKDLAVENLHAAQIATQKANEATKVALENERQVTAALERGELMRVGLDASRRENFAEANRAFEKLEEELKPLQSIASARHYTNRQWKQFASDYGWTLSRLGDTYFKMQQFESAIEVYERGRTVLEEAVKDQLTPTLVDTYHGLGQAYHENARYSTANTDITSLRTGLTPEKQFEKAEEFYKKAVDYQERFNSWAREQNDDPVEANVLTIINSVKLLARLYIDLRKFDEAEKSLKKVIETYKTEEENRAKYGTIGALKELGKFYKDQARYQDAATTYNELIDIEEGYADEATGLRELADSYSALGQVYSGLKDRARSDYLFQLADKIQQLTLKGEFKGADDIEKLVKGGAPITIDDDFDAIGDIYLKLGRIARAESFYEVALFVRKSIESKKRLRAVSQLKLAKLYRDHYKDGNKAEEYYKLAIEELKNSGGRLFGPSDPLSQYVTALRELATLYAGDLNKPQEAETLLNTALTALAPIQGRLAWLHEHRTYLALVELHKKHRPQELEQTLTNRVALMQKRHADFAPTAYRTEDYPLFMAAYIRAVGEAADVYLANNNKTKAEAAYRLVLDDVVPVERFPFSQMAENYASNMEKYLALLRDLKKVTDATNFEMAIRKARARQKELETKEKESQIPQEAPPSNPTVPPNP
jgi:hypothetical protein